MTVSELIEELKKHPGDLPVKMRMEDKYVVNIETVKYFLFEEPFKFELIELIASNCYEDF